MPTEKTISQASEVYSPIGTYLLAACRLGYATAACLSLLSSRLEVVAGTAIILTAATAYGSFFPNPRGAGRIFPVTHVKIISMLLFSPQEVLLGVGMGSFLGYRVRLPKAEAWRAANTASAWGLSAGAGSFVVHFVLARVSPHTASVSLATLLAMIVFQLVNGGIFSLQRSLTLGYPFFAEWFRGVFSPWRLQLLDFPVAVGGVLLAYRFETVEAALAITAASALLVPVARWELGRHYDGTVHSQAGAVLLQSELRFRALIEHITEGISLINAEGIILYLSPSACRVLGRGDSNHFGRSWFEIYHPEDSPRLRASFSSLVRDPGGHFSTDARVLHSDGSWRWVHTVHTNLFMEPNIQAVVATCRDVTQVRRSEETLEEYAARLEDLSRRLVQTQELERRRIARELHDETGQILTGLRLTLDVALQQVGESEAKSTLVRAAAIVQNLQKQVRTLSLNLRPAALDDLGLLPAVLMLCDQHAMHTLIRVKTVHDGVNGRRFAPEIETTAYRIVQEGLTNVARHANVTEATIRLWNDEETLGIQVEDCGKGFAVEYAEFATGSNGLSGMRERVLLVGGEFAVESAPGTGTRLTAELPLRQTTIGAPAVKR
jgi:PAS domain S-box-containing protein